MVLDEQTTPYTWVTVDDFQMMYSAYEWSSLIIPSGCLSLARTSLCILTMCLKVWFVVVLTSCVCWTFNFWDMIRVECKVRTLHMNRPSSIFTP
jgi:hypothetical protein